MGLVKSKPKKQGHDALFDELPEETKQQFFEHCKKWYADHFDPVNNSLEIGWRETYEIDGTKYEVSPVQRWRRWFDSTQDPRSYTISWQLKNGVGTYIFQFVVYPPYLLFVRGSPSAVAPTVPRGRSLGSYSEPQSIPGESGECGNPCRVP